MVPAGPVYHKHTTASGFSSPQPRDANHHRAMKQPGTSPHPYISGLPEDSQNGKKLVRFEARPIDDATILRDLGSVLKGAVVGSCEPCHLGTLTTVRRAWVWHGIVHACTHGG
jgi:hypothetical protein